MVTTASPHDVTLTITRHFHAPVQKVFKAWTTPQGLMKWFAPSDHHSTPSADVDLRIGGRYCIRIQAPDGTVSTAGGVYKEIRPPKRLVFTWAWEAGSGCGATVVTPHDTLVTVQFHDRDQVTDVILTHEHFPTPEDRHAHHEAWTGCLDRLPHALPHH
jgi:uncharacterized protein YndB with AHSA1/START domain